MLLPFFACLNAQRSYLLLTLVLAVCASLHPTMPLYPTVRCRHDCGGIDPKHEDCGCLLLLHVLPVSSVRWLRHHSSQHAWLVVSHSPLSLNHLSHSAIHLFDQQHCIGQVGLLQPRCLQSQQTGSGLWQVIVALEHAYTTT